MFYDYQKIKIVIDRHPFFPISFCLLIEEKFTLFIHFGLDQQLNSKTSEHSLNYLVIYLSTLFKAFQSQMHHPLLGFCFALFAAFELEQKPFSIKKLFSVFEPETSSTAQDEAYKKVHEEYKQLVSKK